jgi:hypothetical protein
VVNIIPRLPGDRWECGKKIFEKDVNSLDWFLTKTGEQGSVPMSRKKLLIESPPARFPSGENLAATR